MRDTVAIDLFIVQLGIVLDEADNMPDGPVVDPDRDVLLGFFQNG